MNFSLRFIYLLLLLLLGCALVTNLYAQRNQLPFVKQHLGKEYKASVSNHAIAKDSSGVLYFGNQGGLLIYDGTNWELNPIAGGRAVSSLEINNANKIYIGLKNEFGYADLNMKGLVNYTSLSQSIRDLEFGRVHSILCVNSMVYFQSLKYIFRYSSLGIQIWPIENGTIDFGGLFLNNEEVHFFLIDKGLFKINKNDSIELVEDALKNERILGITKTDELNFLSLKSNIYHFGKNSIEQHADFPKEIKDIISKEVPKNLIINHAAGNRNYIIGTRKNGIYAINNNEISYHLFDKNGLSNNESRELMSVNNDLWQVTQSGINNIQNYNAWSFWNQKTILSSLIWDIIRVDNEIYLASSEGLYKLSNGNISKLDKNENHIYYSFQHNTENLLVNSSIGIYSFNQNVMKLELELDIAFNSLAVDSNSFISLSRSGMQLFRNSNDKIEVDRILSSDLTGISRSALKHKGEFWLSLADHGIIFIDSSFNVIKFDENHGLPMIKYPSFINYKSNLLIATQNGFYKLNDDPKPDSTDIFIPDFSLIKERIDISYPVSDSNGNIWYVTTYGKFDSKIEKLELQKDSTYIKVTRPFKWLPQQEFTNIYPDPIDDGIIWIAGTEGLYRYDDNVEVDYDAPFNTLIRKVHTGDSLIFGGTYFDKTDTSTVPSIVFEQPDSFKPKFNYDYNNISFQFTATSYDVPEKNQYSYFLKGNDEYWSDLSIENKKEYTNLNPGKYTFMVKSTNVYETKGRAASYEFTILPPWYMTSLARVLFVLIGILGLWVIIRLYTYRLRMQRQKLKLIVADRTFEVMKQSTAIEKQHLLLQEQTDEIKQQRDDIQEKNQELESSQEKILSINHQLEKEVVKRTKKIKSTLIQLQKTNKELDTFIYRASHDLKSPVSRIMGLSTLAKLEIPDSEHREYFNLIELAANEMKTLLAKLTQVHELLNTKIQIQEIDIPTLLSSIREKLKHLDRNNDTKYSFDIKNSLLLKSDEDVIEIIIENLLENALIFRKINSDDTHHIQLQLFEKDGFINMVVLDNGLGVQNEHHEQLFNMFFRASDHSKGTGLGLYLVKIAVDKLDGTISVDSKLGEYTKFTVQLPIN